jgi:hypothetical protein
MSRGPRPSNINLQTRRSTAAPLTALILEPLSRLEPTDQFAPGKRLD